MKTVSIVSLLALTSAVQAASISYDFNDNTQSVVSAPATVAQSPNTATVVGAGFTVSNPLSESVTNRYNISYINGSTSVDTTVGRFYTPAGVGANTNPSSSSASHVDFAIAADAGNTFDFTLASLNFTAFAANSTTNSSNTIYINAFYSTDGSTYTQLGSTVIASNTSVPNNLGTHHRSYPTDGGSIANPYNVTLSPAADSLASLPADLTTLYIRLALGAAGSSNVAPSISNTSANSAVKAVGFDDLQLTGFTTVPEPASVGLFALGSMALLRRRT